jgi:hypothetical protein
VGGVVRTGDLSSELRLRGAAATATALFTGGVAGSVRRGAWAASAAAFREVRDVGDAPVVARLSNSLFAQETGRDYGDYYLATGGEGAVSRALGGRAVWRVTVGAARVESLAVAATWARGTYRRPNPAVGEGTWTYARFGLRRQASSFAMVREFSGRVELEGAGFAAERYGRLYAEGRWQLPLGPGWAVLRGSVGLGTSGLPAHRAFALGGRGSLVGEGFRAFAGRRAAWASADLRLPVPAPDIPLGSFASTGPTATLVPFVAAGWVGGAVTGVPGTPSRGLRPVLGLGVEWPRELLRVDVGVSPLSGHVGLAVDVSRGFWDIL